MVNGDKTKNRGRFSVPGHATRPPASTQSEPPTSGDKPQPVQARRAFKPLSLVALFGLLLLICIAAVIWPVVSSAAGDLAEVAAGLFIVFVLLAGHAMTTWWCLTRKPGKTQWAILHTPYLALYAMTYMWFFHGWSMARGGPPSLWYLPWTIAALLSLSWLIVWWLRGERINPQRAIRFFVGLAVLLVLNGGALFGTAWKTTDGFGLQGQPTPRDAWAAYTATSCLFEHAWYTKGGKNVEASCPDWDRVEGPELAAQTTGSQPRDVLARWFEAHQQFDYLPRLKYHSPQIEHQDDDAATLRVVIEAGDGDGQDFNAIAAEDFWCFTVGAKETWTVRLETVALGGWKVSKVDVANPVQVVPYLGSPCQSSGR